MIAVVGLACELPDASTPQQLWENVLARRRAFRRLPPERLRLEDYWSEDHSAEDRIYATEAALIEGYEFDRLRFRVPGAAFRAADLTHWLALDVACRALADAGHPDGAGLPRETTGVLLGNTLTGEISRAALLRLRWPYVRRVVDAALRDEDGVGEDRRRSLLARIEASYKAPFAPVGDESLAGALSNTIAGRVCNHLDLGGGGYTVDGACASSLLAVITACERLSAGELDVALAGGVDVSLDPFELVGFAKTGALAPEEMRVYDARSQGFWPGEGCGFVVLMREADARAAGARVHALIRGWGISSDGSGGITRPEAAGQLRALRRAYRRADTPVAAVGYFEGHGTGTAVGDATELRALATARGAAAPAAAIGSIKANIGHTKAAAGISGLIKATLAVREGVVPPTTGCEDPHPELLAGGALRVVGDGEPWPGAERVAGVSAMGFGGINSHVVLAADTAARGRERLAPRERMLLASSQDAELFLFAGEDADELSAAVERLRARAAGLSRAQLGDCAAALAATPRAGRLRAAVVASRPAELAERLQMLAERVAVGAERAIDTPPGVFLGASDRAPRIGLLLPGQGAPAHVDGGALRRRFPIVEDLFAEPLPAGVVDTAVAQPAILRASLAALRVLDVLGVEAEVAVGHSLGEITALIWAGALDEAAGRRIAAGRGRAMSGLGGPRGAMAGLGLDREQALALAEGLPLALAGLNAPAQTVLSGPGDAIDVLIARAAARDVTVTPLRVSHAFHSPAMAPAAGALAALLAVEVLAPPRRSVVSTVTGAPLTDGEDVRALLCRQLTAPVRFAEALATAAAGLDLLVEAGPGRVLSGLAAASVPVPVMAIDSGGRSLAGLLSAVAAAWALGAPVRIDALFASRFTRPIDLDRPPRLIANPCERAPWAPPSPPAGDEPALVDAPSARDEPALVDAPPADRLALVRELVAARAELPPSAVAADSRLLDDLHLNSIVVSEIAVEAARRLGMPPPLAPAALANVTVATLAEAVAEAGAGALTRAQEQLDPPGAGPWTRAFTIAHEPRPRRPGPAPPADGGTWRVFAAPGDPLEAALAALASRRAGVALRLPADPDERQLALVLDAAHAVLAAPAPRRLLVVQTGGGGGGFARALHLEHPDVATAVVDVPAGEPGACWAAEEAAGLDSGFVEAVYDSDGVRSEPVLRHLAVPPAGLQLGEADVLLLAGGAAGIAAECAVALAAGSAAGLGCVGRSDPAHDPRLAAALDRLSAAGLRVHYVPADVTDAAAVAAAVAAISAALGPVTAVLHAAGANQPALVADLDEPRLAATVAPKVAGLRNVLAVLDGTPLRLLVTFGSVIARAGMRGDAHYALANDWQTRLTERYAVAHPGCACLAFESSVWSAVGMGERLGRIEALARAGIDAIPPADGAALLARLAATRERPVAVVAAGRLGSMPTLRRERVALPLWRFLERPRADYPGVELVADAELSVDLDPYLADHVLDGEALLPAVIGLEAMAQAVRALTGAAGAPAFEDVRFERPVVIPAAERTAVRVAALADDARSGRVVLRSGRTGFAVDHFTARWHLDEVRDGVRATPALPPLVAADGSGAGLDPGALYGTLLFQSGRFRRLLRYERLSATECHAVIEAREPVGWFGAFLPPELVLGDPGAHDAALHALQACVPHARVVPVGADGVLLRPGAPGPRHVHARERERGPGSFTFDVAVRDATGALLERWDGLRLRAVAPVTPAGPWPEALLATYLERRLERLDRSLRVAVGPRGETARRGRSDAAIRRALGAPVAVRRRADGRPEVDGGRGVSTAHADGMTLAVAGAAPVACDVEAALPRPPDVWRDLLGPERGALSETIAAARGEDVSTAATRVWAAGECLQKIGLPAGAPLTVAADADDGWLLLACGDRSVATYVTRVSGFAAPVAVAVLAGGPDARL